MDWGAIALWIALSCGAFVCIVAAALFIIPLRIIAQSGYRAEGLAARVEVRFALGLLVARLSFAGVELLFFGRRLWRSPPSRGMIAKLRSSMRDKEQRESWQRRARWGRDKLRAALPHWRAFISMGQRFVRVVRYHCTIRGTIGLDDPADTAMFFEAIRWLRLFFPRLDLALARDYLDETLELDAEVRLQVWPPRLALVGLGVLMTRETRQALFAVR